MKKAKTKSNASKKIKEAPALPTEVFFIYLPLDIDSCLAKHQSPHEEHKHLHNQSLLKHLFHRIIGAEDNKLNQHSHDLRIVKLFKERDTAIQEASQNKKHFSLVTLKIPVTKLVADRVRLLYEEIQSIEGFDEQAALGKQQRLNGATANSSLDHLKKSA